MVEATAPAVAGNDFADGDDDAAIVASISGAEPMVKLPHGFRIKNGGLWFYPEGEGDAAYPYCVAGAIDVLAQTRDDTGASWGLLLGWQDGDGRPHRWAMPSRLVGGDGGEICATLMDRGLYVSPRAARRARLMEFLATVTIDARARAVDRIGWTDGAFALPDRTIGDTPAHRVIYQAPGAADHEYRSAGTLEGWQHQVARFGSGNSRLALSLSAAFVGPLLSLIGEEGGGLNMRGKSSIGKTTVLTAAASAWGPPKFVRQWRATSNGLEGVAVQHSETLLCLDELAQLDPKEAGHVAYLLANGAGKARAGRAGSLRSPAQWTVFFLSSGEISLAELAGRDGRGARRSAAGQEVRILDIEADASRGFGLFETLHDGLSPEKQSRAIKDGAARHYGLAGPAFVEQLVGNVDRIARALRQGIEGFARNNVPADASGQVARAARRFGLIATAGEMATRAGILPWQQGEATGAAEIVFRDWLVGRGGAGSAEDRQAIERVAGFIEAHGASRFEPVTLDDHAPRIINRAGFWREGDAGREYLFLPEAWKNEVCAGLNASQVTKVLAEAGHLKRDAAGKNSLPLNLPGLGKVRCIVVTNSILAGANDA